MWSGKRSVGRGLEVGTSGERTHGREVAVRIPLASPETDLDDSMEGKYWEHLGQSFVSKAASLTALIDGAHGPSEGGFRETLTREFLSGQLPGRLRVSTGFVKFGTVVSRQIDVLIWDQHSYAPLFESGDFVVIEPEACRAVIEVKTTLSASSLRSSLELLHPIEWDTYSNGPLIPPVRGIFSFKTKWKNPASLVKQVAEFYREKYKGREAFIPMRVKGPRLWSSAFSPDSELGHFSWPRFVHLIDMLAIVEPSWTLTQGRVVNSHPDYSGWDPTIEVHEHDSSGAAAGFAAAVVSEILGRDDSSSGARHRRRRLQPLPSQTWLLGGIPAQPPLPENATFKVIEPPVFLRPFGSGRKFPGGHHHLKTAGTHPRDKYAECAWAGCREYHPNRDRSKKEGWGLYTHRLSKSEPLEIWLCPDHNQRSKDEPSLLLGAVGAALLEKDPYT